MSWLCGLVLLAEIASILDLGLLLKFWCNCFDFDLLIGCLCFDCLGLFVLLVGFVLLGLVGFLFALSCGVTLWFVA